ncbi:MAG: GON domain-containing protein [Actinoallomurus sp.]
MFSSCQDIHRAIPIARDGTYLLFNNGNIFTVYCSRMATIMPSEYIDLARTGQNVNFSQYTAGGASPGTNVRTTFTKLRVDPRTLTVDIGDQTFATSTGSLRHGSTTVTSMPYGVAMSCTSKANGLGNIDLQDTPFRVDNTFATGGFKASGSATPSPSGQVVDLRGGGFCGWTMSVPELYNPFNPSPGTYHLKVNCAQNGVLPAHRQICVHLGGTAGLTTQVRRDGGRPSVIVWQDGRPVAASGLDGRARFLG